MQNSIKRLATLVATAWLLGSTSLAASDCIDHVIQPPGGLVEIIDTALLDEAVKPVNDGGLCAGRVYEVTTPGVTVFRVWNASKDYTAYGSWWSFDQPEGPRRKYRKDNVICAEWSDLDRLHSCEITVGTRIVVGPGQSAQCESTGRTMHQSPVNQVYIPNDTRNEELYVEKCSDDEPWP